jgi:hypothetical protein
VELNHDIYDAFTDLGFRLPMCVSLTEGTFYHAGGVIVKGSLPGFQIDVLFIEYP